MKYRLTNYAQLIEEFVEAIDEAEEGVRDPEALPSVTEWRKGYVMGLCMGAALAKLPKDVWASPERHGRQVDISLPSSEGSLTGLIRGLHGRSAVQKVIRQLLGKS